MISGKILMYVYSSKTYHYHDLTSYSLIITLSLIKGCSMSVEMNASRSHHL